MLRIIITLLAFSFSLFCQELPKLCLHMIVKDEAHVIERCLDAVKPYVDYWVIVDTGSTDGTQEMILNHMKDMPGELHEIPWKNWGATRSEAIEFALNKSEYILLMDADDILVFNEGATLPEMTADMYNMWRGSKSFVYQRPQIIKGDLPWRYIGVTHEYLDCPDPYTSETLDMVRYVTLDDGACSKDPKKFWKNVELLEQGLKDEPNNCRYAFYLAESYRDCHEKGKALEWYQKRVDMGGWDQEVFWSKLMISHLLREMNFPKSIVLESYMHVHAYRPHRDEPVFFLAEILNELGRYKEAYQWLKSQQMITKPRDQDALFNVGWISEYGLLFQLSICAYYVGQNEEALDACNELLAMEDLPEAWRTLAESNKVFPLEKLRDKLAKQ